MANNKLASNKPILVTLILVIIGIITTIGYFVFSMDTAPPSVTELIVIPEVVPSPAPTVVESVPSRVSEVVPETIDVVTEPAFVLPLLNDSDPLARDGVVSLTRHEDINLWLSPNELLRKFVAFSDHVANGQVAKQPVRVLAPEGPFLVKKINDTEYEINPVSYDRYNSFTEIVLSIDARRGAEFYHLLRPLIDEAYGELGYGEKSFDDVVFKAIGRLLETPLSDAPVVLIQPVVMYEFKDPKLESLSPAQKQLIRMGPKNARLLQKKIAEVALELRAILERD